MTVHRPDAPVAFATSGSTGPPQQWLRDPAQIDAEARLLTALCADGGIDGVLSYAPPRHLYGHLMGLAVPRLLDVPCLQAGLTAPLARTVTRWRRPLVAAVPAAFAVLARCLPELARAERIVLVHSSAVLPAGARELVAALGERARLVELFGSTETGLIATRSGGAGEWTLAEDTRFAPEQEQEQARDRRPDGSRLLRVTSPRLARRPGEEVPAATATGDLVTAPDERTFHWHGRANRLVKVNGVRVDLDHLTARLAAAVPGVALACRAEPDPLRGEWFSVHAATDDPGLLARLAAAVRALPAAEQPRALHPLPAPAPPTREVR
ncbi:AMP-binding protein [Kitasatospora sp. NPDC048540]|uniref:AMP-binding protein n=1 Tax=unclassified Kitasatospora TaxID=2633591 RepID=UPI00068CF752|nr:AMP-binding protein [Kitasatospora sp. MBT63]